MSQYIINPIKPLTINQSKIFKSFEAGKNVFIHGWPGTGKTLVALYLALDTVMNHPEEGFRKVIIVRSTVPARREGFLPGNHSEKSEIYETPYQTVVDEELFERANPQAHGGAYKWLKGSDLLQFVSTSYLRGVTFRDAIVIIDEVQNMNMGEINTTITRMGKGCKIIVIGDSYQNDLLYLREDSCIDNIKPIIKKMKSFDIVQMEIKDNCRDDVVSEWLIASNVAV